MNIETKYVEKINEEKQGKELYFETIPTAKEREELKRNGYRWSNYNKCWYIKLSQEGKIVEIKTSAQNYLNIKIGDIFSFTWGYEQTNRNYFQVVGLKGSKQIIIREINYKITETTGYESYNVLPELNSFKNNSQFIDDNEKGATKTVKVTPDGKPYINMESFGWCSLWEGKEEYITCYY